MKSVLVFLLSVLLATGLLPGGLNQAAAQTADGSWSQPVNLSTSGGTANPQIVVDSGQVAHVFWEDAYANMVYTSGDGKTWQPPVALDLPFFQSNTQLLADGRGLLYAFWLTPDNDLSYSYVTAANAGDAASWSAPVLMSANIIAFKASIDNGDQVHLAYILAQESADNPAGVYYTQTLRGSQAWSIPRLIYASRYYRTLLPLPGSITPQSGLAGSLTTLDVAAVVVDGQTQVYIGWDDSALKRNYFARSLDGGTTWSVPIDLDSPESLASYQTPRNVRLVTTGDGLLVLWDRADSNGESCTQQYRFSTNNRVSWTIEGNLWQDFGACPSEMTFFKTSASQILVSAIIQEQIYLMAWNGKQWSDVQNQRDLISFDNPATLDVVDFKCQKAALQESQLVTVGCDNSSGGDIWAATRAISDVPGWFVDRVGWSVAQAVEAGQTPITSVQLVSDPQEDIYLYWSGETPSTTEVRIGIQGATVVNGKLVGPYEIQQITEGMPKGLVSVYLEGFDRLVSLWQAGNAGTLYSAWSSSKEGINLQGWSDAAPLQPPDSYGSGPALLLTPDGKTIVLYSIPFNEKRGIYQVISHDGGISWDPASAVVTVGQVQCAGFDAVQISRVDSQVFNGLFTCTSLPNGIGPLELFALRSTDGGITWSSPQLVSEAPVQWSRILSSETGQVVRLWQDNSSASAQLWFSFSEDSGVNWTAPDNFYSNPDLSTLVDVVEDSTGKVYVTAVSQRTLEDEPVLDILNWSGNTWERGPSMTIPKRFVGQVTALSSALIGNHSLGVGMAGFAINLLTGISTNRILFTQLPVEISTVENMAIVIPTAQPTITVETQTNNIEDAATVVPPDFSRQGGRGLPAWIGIALGGGLALFLIGGVIVYTRYHKKPPED